MRKQRLSRKELVEQIRQTMPIDYNEYEKLAFIEFQIAQNISFDEKYLWGDIGTKEKIYKLARVGAQRPHNQIKRKIICVDMAELFGHVAKEFGFDIKYQKRTIDSQIKSGGNEIFRTISAKKREHVCPIVGLSNGQFIEVDIQGDLARLQTRSKPQYFGGSVHGSKTENGIEIATLDKDIINRTFRKVYQLRDNERFTDEYIMVYSAILRCQGKTPIEMIKFFMDDPKIQKELKNTRCIEASKMYKMILNVCYDFSDGKQFIKGNNHAIIEECILSNDEGEKRYSFCIFAQDKEEKEFYIYSKKSRRMVNFTQEEIKQMTRQVMNVGFGGRKSEIKKEMISFINGDGLDYKESKQEISKTSIDDIFLE